MVDFVAVIEKAVNGLAENTPEMRDKVYGKARAAINRQLENIDPPISDAVKDKQLAKLEDAIAEVESRNVEAAIDEDAFSDVFSESDATAMEAESQGVKPQPPASESVEPASPAPPPPATPPTPPPPMPPPPADDIAHPPGHEYEQTGYDQFGLDDAEPAGPKPRDDYGQDYLADQPGEEYFETNRSGILRTAAIAVGVLFLVVGLAFALWFMRGDIIALVYSPSSTVEESAAPTADSDLQEETVEAPEVDTAAVLPGAADSPVPAAEDQKFTQRLLEDGSEVDTGPAAASARPSAEEGKSVTAIDETAQETALVAPTAEPATEADPPVIRQKMFIYEEQPGQVSPSAQEGTVAWQIVRESPGDNLPPEPAIQASLDVPEKGLSAVLTIKRNADASLPASHLIEIVFDLTESFQGGAIDSIQNFAMKDTEEATGDSLIAVPAKITDSFFMIALNDFSEAVALNTSLLRDRNWIDLPVAYGNGQRALLTLEKGSTGAEVFDQVIRAWDSRSTPTAQSQ